MFEDFEIAVPCPKCGNKTKKRVSWLKANKQMTCSCGAVVDLDTTGLFKGLDDARRSMEDLKRNLGKMFK